MRALPLRGSLLAASVAALAVVGTSRSAEAGEIPAYSAISTGHMSPIPSATAPARIGAREQLPGIHVVSRPKSGRGKGMDVTAVVATPEEAAAVRGSRGAEFKPGMAPVRETCFTERDRDVRSRMDQDATDSKAPQLWSASMNSELNLWPKQANVPDGGVTAIHREEVVAKDGKVTLETVDAWIDPVTLGARLIAKSSVPLTLVAKAVGNVTVYAARDELGGRRFVHFVVLRDASEMAARRLGGVVGIRQDGGTSHGGCGHLRMTLEAVAEDSDSGVVIAPVELPSRAENGATEPAAKAKESAPPPPPPPPPRRVRSVKGAPGPKAILMGMVGSPTPPPEPVERENRQREMQIHLGVSQGSRDPAPILSVSFGWANRETVSRVFE